MDVKINNTVKKFIFENTRPHLVFRSVTLPYLLREDGYKIETEIKDGDMLYYFISESGKKIDITKTINQAVDLGLEQGKKVLVSSKDNTEDAQESQDSLGYGGVVLGIGAARMIPK